jgi:hypothetical protein
MKTLLILAYLLATSVTPLRAQEAGDIGAGVIIGNVTGGTAKFWINNNWALDAGVGLSRDLILYGDYLWHSWAARPQPTAGKLPLYLGLGGQLRASSPNEFGLRTVAGIGYWLPRNPIEFFLEIVPVFSLHHRGGIDVNAGVGLRYYFRGSIKGEPHVQSAEI